MPFYMITYGLTQIDEIYIGETEHHVIANARTLIDQWPKYATLSDECIANLLKLKQLEFELIPVNAPWPGESFNPQHFISFYEARLGNRPDCNGALIAPD